MVYSIWCMVHTTSYIPRYIPPVYKPAICMMSLYIPWYIPCCKWYGIYHYICHGILHGICHMVYTMVHILVYTHFEWSIPWYIAWYIPYGIFYMMYPSGCMVYTIQKCYIPWGNPAAWDGAARDCPQPMWFKVSFRLVVTQ